MHSCFTVNFAFTLFIIRKPCFKLRIIQSIFLLLYVKLPAATAYSAFSLILIRKVLRQLPAATVYSAFSLILIRKVLRQLPAATAYSAFSLILIRKVLRQFPAATAYSAFSLILIRKVLRCKKTCGVHTNTAGLYFAFNYFSTSATVSLAIASSSLVGRSITLTEESSAEMMAFLPRTSFFSSSIFTPMKPR